MEIVLQVNSENTKCTGIKNCGLLGYDALEPVTSTFRAPSRKMEALGSSDTLVTTYKSTRRYTPEDHSPNLHRSKSIKSTVYYIHVLSPECISRS